MYNKILMLICCFLAMPFGQCPVLEVDGKMLAQSNTIARYLARQHGLAGKDEWEQSQADAYADSIGDLMTGSTWAAVIIYSHFLQQLNYL